MMQPPPSQETALVPATAAAPPGPPVKNLAETVWTRLDRKATAIAEFTMRQYRKKRSTWSVAAVGVLLVTLVMLFYIEAMAEGLPSEDQDDDSYDWDGDGYPNGQEILHGTRTWDGSHFPQGVDPDPPEVWVDEDGIDYDGTTNPNQGHDDDGDCWALEPWERDSNNDGIPCNVRYYFDEEGNVLRIEKDRNVDEDPDDAAFLNEAVHRSFLLGFGKFGYLFVLGIFIPLFLATGLIRDEHEAGTLHYLVGKPIARAEVLMYRLLGFIGLAWPYFLGLIFLSSQVTGLFGPGDGIYRFSDLGIWFGVFLAASLVVLTYATIFATFGIITPKYGVLLALLFAFWEFVMMFLAMVPATRNMGIASLSVSFWGSEIINSVAWLVWSDHAAMSQQAEALGWVGDVALWQVWLSPFPTTLAIVNLVVSMLVLVMITGLFVLIGQRSFKKRELD